MSEVTYVDDEHLESIQIFGLSRRRTKLRRGPEEETIMKTKVRSRMEREKKNQPGNRRIVEDWETEQRPMGFPSHSGSNSLMTLILWSRTYARCTNSFASESYGESLSPLNPGCSSILLSILLLESGHCDKTTGLSPTQHHKGLEY